MQKTNADDFGKLGASANRYNLNKTAFSYSKICITVFTAIFIIFVAALDSSAFGESVDEFDGLKFYLGQDENEIEWLKFDSELAKNDYEEIKTLFDYTKFHIGIYITLGTVLVAAFGTKILPRSKPVLVLAIICIGIAGFAGGIVASTLPESESLKLFFVNETGPFGCKWFSGRCWTYIEHTAFWFGIIIGALSFMLPSEIWPKWLRSRQENEQEIQIRELENKILELEKILGLQNKVIELKNKVIELKKSVGTKNANG